MDLSIVIVSYKTPRLLRRCLETLDAHASRYSREVLVVDNHSEDESADIARSFPGVVVIETGRNLGFAGGANRGLEAARGRYCLILNPDVEVGEGSLDALVEFLDAHPDCGIAGPKLLNPDGSLQYSCRRVYTLRTILLRRTFLGRLFPHARALQRHLMLDYDHAEPRAVDWVVGAAMIVRREAVQDVGPMDERYFLYFEDVDWCTRMAARGWSVFYVPDAVMTHHWQRASRGLGRSARIHLRSGLHFYERWGALLYLIRQNRGAWTAAALVALDALGIGAAFLIGYLTRHALASVLSKPLFPLEYYAGFIVTGVVVFLASYAGHGLYRTIRDGDWVDTAFRIVRASTLGLVVVMASTFVLDMRGFSRLMVLVSWPLAAVFTFLGRRLLHALTARVLRERLNLRRVALLGQDPVLDRLDRLMRSRPELGWEPVRLPHAFHGEGKRLEVLSRQLRQERVTGLVVTPASMGVPEEEFADRIAPLRRAGFHVRVAAGFLSGLPARARLESVGGISWLTLERPALRPAGVRKRLLDLSLAAILAVLGAVPAGLIALGRKLVRRPVWEPERTVAGRWGETVHLRRLAGGGWFRNVPLLGAVFRGRCSVVGPRPLPVGAEPPGGEAWGRVRSHYRPGLVGPWTLTPGLGSEEEMVQELRYLEDWSVETDIKLLTRVALRSFRSGGGRGSPSPRTRDESGVESPPIEPAGLSAEMKPT